MKVIVVGLGVQGYKRRLHAGADFVSSVDPENAEADFTSIYDVPLESFDAALLCIPDEPKVELIGYLLKNSKHVLVEKPLWASDEAEMRNLEELAVANDVVCYTAYNHRFEPHYVRMRDLVRSGELGKIYRCRMFYGNGTARLVKESEWRDQGAGVLPDLGSHLLDTITFWFGETREDFRVVSANRFENKSPDHVVIAADGSGPKIELEMTLLMWRNHFTCDILAENGSAHIESLCKWGPAKFVHRTRVLPSGRPLEDEDVLVQEDPTWATEYAHFKKLCETGVQTNFDQDIWLQRTLGQLGSEIRS